MNDQDQLKDEIEYENWENLDYEGYDEAQDIITPPIGVYDLSVLGANLNKDTKRINLRYRIQNVVQIRDEDKREEVEEGTTQCMETLFPPKRGEFRKDERGVGILKKMVRVLLNNTLGHGGLGIADALTQLEQIYGPDEGVFIRRTISQRVDRKKSGVVYADFRTDFKTVNQEGDEV